MGLNMFRITVVTAGLVIAVAVSAVPTAVAAGQDPAGTGTIALPPGGPVATYPQDQSVGGANPFVPFGTDPYVPVGVWAP